MVEDRARFRLNLSAREIEVEGSESFVREHVERLEMLLDRFVSDEPAALPAAPPAVNGSAAPNRGHSNGQALGSFGEYIQHLPKSATDVDKMLAAGYFAQTRMGDNAFSTGDANKLLTEQGIKLGNPSQCVKQNLVAKRVFTLSKGRYRTSQQGLDYLRQTMGQHVVEGTAGGHASAGAPA